MTIRKQRHYQHSPEDVWAAITDPFALAEWMEPNDHKPEVGHKFQFRTDPGVCGEATECEVLEADAPRRLVWSWAHVAKNPSGPHPDPMTIIWTLEPEGGGTRLTLEHTDAENIGFIMRNMMRVGWGYMLKKLIPKVLGNVEGGKFTPGAIPLEKRAYRCTTVPEQYVR